VGVAGAAIFNSGMHTIHVYFIMISLFGMKSLSIVCMIIRDAINNAIL
jgi:hypothetical protein